MTTILLSRRGVPVLRRVLDEVVADDDHDDPLVAPRVPMLGSVLNEVVADGDHDVGLLEARQRVIALV